MMLSNSSMVSNDASHNSVDTHHSSSTSSRNRGNSKAQLSLQKILDTISATPPPPHRVHFNTIDRDESSGIAKSSLSAINFSEYESTRMGNNIDLNLIHPAPPSETHQDSRPPATHGGEKVQNEVFESEMKSNAGPESEEGMKLNLNPEEEMGKKEENRSRKYFEALIDAVEEASREYANGGGSKAAKNPNEPIKTEEMIKESSARKRRRLERKIEEDERMAVAIAEEESTSPVVKSKRGRSQVLPYKYRDSVMEPLCQLSSRHRGFSAANGPTRRRPR